MDEDRKDWNVLVWSKIWGQILEELSLHYPGYQTDSHF